MRNAVSQEHSRQEWRWVALLPMAVATGWAALTFTRKPILLALVAGLCLYAVLFAASVRRPLVFVTIFLIVLTVLPPFYSSALLDTPLYVSVLLLPIALTILAFRSGELRFRLDPIAKGLAIFLAGTGLSVPFAFLLSGDAAGMQSLLRWLMLAQALLIYAIIRGPGFAESATSMVPLLVVAAVISAGYGVIDFFSPMSFPHPAAEQFMWLEDSVLRRAQGVFYESSSFANFCGFFLVVCSAALLAAQERVLRIRRCWLLVFVIILALAVVFAFSRGEWGCVLLSLLVFGVVSRQVKFGRALLLPLLLVAPLAALRWRLPEMWNYLATGRIGSLMQIFADPNLASSGRFHVWARVISIMQDNPLYLFFGIGYKTLPLTRLFHGEIITDNGYLSLLLETGVLGLGGFLVFCRSILRTFLTLARTRSGAVAFWSALLFSFWCGECLQMLTADAYTYWRNMIVFTAFMAVALNLSERERPAGSCGARNH